MNNNPGSVEDIIFDANYRRTLEKLEHAAAKDDFTISDIKNELETLYRYEGLDWTGRGSIKHSEIGGAILAYQVFINKWNMSEGK